jgi:hypothetical protein
MHSHGGRGDLERGCDGGDAVPVEAQTDACALLRREHVERGRKVGSLLDGAGSPREAHASRVAR